MVTTSTKDDSVEHEESKPKDRNNEGLDLSVSWSLLPSLSLGGHSYKVSTTN